MVSFYIDGVLYQSVADAPFQVWWSLEPGQHQVSAIAQLADGQSIQSETVSFRVK